MLLVGSHDTTLALQFFNGWETKLAQYWRPFVSKTDSIAVYFRVNMGGATFNPATQVVDVRGGLPLGADPTWITIKTLAAKPTASTAVHSGRVWPMFPRRALRPGQRSSCSSLSFNPKSGKEDPPGNRSFTFSGTNDTTIHWYYFNDRAPSGPKVDGTVLFIAKLDALEKARMFNRALGDKIAVTGAKGGLRAPLTLTQNRPCSR